MVKLAISAICLFTKLIHIIYPLSTHHLFLKPIERQKKRTKPKKTTMREMSEFHRNKTFILTVKVSPRELQFLVQFLNLSKISIYQQKTLDATHITFIFLKLILKKNFKTLRKVIRFLSYSINDEASFIFSKKTCGTYYKLKNTDKPSLNVS